MMRLLRITTVLLTSLLFLPNLACADPSREAIQAEIQKLVENLNNPKPYERRAAAESLGDFGQSARPAVPPLVTALSDEIPDVRAAVAYALGRISADANTSVPALVSSLEDPDPFVRSTVIAALNHFPKKGALIAPALGQLLDDPDESVRLAAANTLGGLGAEAVTTLRNILQHPDPMVRVTAVAALGGTGIYAERALPELLAALDQPIGEIRRAAATALGKIASDKHWPITRPWDPMGYDYKPIWPRPMRTPLRQSLYTRLHNRIIFFTIPALSQVLDDPESGVRAAALRALGTIGSEAASTIPLIIEIEVVNDENPNVRRAAITALGNIGNSSDYVLQILIDAFSDADSDVRLAASRSIAKMKDAPVGLLITAMDNPDSGVRFLVATTLENIGHEATLAIPVLSQALQDEDEDVRLAATYALEAIEGSLISE